MILSGGKFESHRGGDALPYDVEKRTIDQLETGEPGFLWYLFIPYGAVAVFQVQAGYG